MKTRTKNKQSTLSSQAAFSEVLGKIILTALIFASVFPFLIIIPLILLKSYGLEVSIMSFICELLLLYGVFFLRRLYKKIPFFKKTSIHHFNKKTYIPTIQIQNHHNYYPWHKIKTKYNLYKFWRDVTIIGSINMIAMLLNITYMLMKWFSIWQSISWNVLLIFIALWLQYYLYYDYKKWNKIEKIKHHYLLHINPKKYYKKNDTIFFY